VPAIPVNLELLDALAAEAPVAPPQHENNSRSHGRAFDIDAFLQQNEFDVVGPDEYQGGRRWTFRRSPMCDHHDDGPYLIQFANGALCAGCHHDSCSWGWRELRARYEPSISRASTVDDNALPEVMLPGGAQTISATAGRLGELLAARESHFLRGGVVTRVQPDHVLEPVRPEEMASDFEQVARLVKTGRDGRGAAATVPAICSENMAKRIMSAESFKLALPQLRLVSPCPVMIERDGRLVVITGYDRASGILAGGAAPPTLTTARAVELLNELTTDFRYVEPHDRSRDIAAKLTPGFVAGDLLPARVPTDVTEADQSQSGKGYRNKLTAAVYNQKPAVITQSPKGGVGSLEEAFDAALIRGANFLCLDNVKQKIDSPKIESFLTEDSYSARCAFSKNTQISPKRTVVMLTSNKAELSRDLGNRSSIVRILKQPAGYEFGTYPEGDLLQHVLANQQLYLGAVFAVIRAWHAAGRPRTNETRHDFRLWAQVMDWIVQNLFDAAPLLEGHREAQNRVTTPYLNWLREVALAVIRQERAGTWMFASGLFNVIRRDGNIDVPGLRESASIEDEAARNAVLQQIGRRLSDAFGAEDRLTIDRLIIERETYRDEHRRERHRYRVVLAGEGDACGGAGAAGPAGEEQCR
jgi:hypothetical protein